MKMKNNKGITLVALVITIVVLLILAGVTIGTLESNGVIGKAKKARTETANAEANDIATIDEYFSYIEEKTGNGGEEERVPGATFSDNETLTWEQLRDPANGTKYGYKADLINENSLVCDGDYSAFEFCTSLVSITIPDSVTNIGYYTFRSCSNLKSCTLPNSITTITLGVFYNCSSLTSVTIPDSVTKIDNESFNYCSGLISITIPKNITSIEDDAFIGCANLENIIVDSNNTVFDSRNNCNALIEKATNTLVTGCKNTTIPDGVTSIGSSAFYNCTSLTSITIPSSVTSIGYYTFQNCTSLASVTIPSSVKSIAMAAFYGCTSLTSIKIPSSVTSIGNFAFNNCTSVTSFKVGSEGVKTLVEDSGYEGTVTVDTSIN